MVERFLIEVLPAFGGENHARRGEIGDVQLTVLPSQALLMETEGVLTRL